MARQSAGILLYRIRGGSVELLLVHPGGPFWVGKDEGVWSIPKGEYDEGEDARAAAVRELEEETGIALAPVGLLELGSIRQKGGKVVRAWAAELDVDAETLHSNTFTLEWPRGSGRLREFPEVDRAEWLDPESARRKLNPAQSELVDRLLGALAPGM
jgi:predicted NUDIX family NTP pyrophosphohydrolase